MTPLELAKFQTLAREVARLGEENHRIAQLGIKYRDELHVVRSQLNSLKEAWENLEASVEGLVPSTKTYDDAWNRLSKAFSELGTLTKVGNTTKNAKAEKNSHQSESELGKADK